MNPTYQQVPNNYKAVLCFSLQGTGFISFPKLCFLGSGFLTVMAVWIQCVYLALEPIWGSVF